MLAEHTQTRAKRQQLPKTKERLEKVATIMSGDSAFIDDKNTLCNELVSMGSSQSITLDQLSEKLNLSSIINHTPC